MSEYPDVPQSPNFPEIETRTLDFWARDDTFKASVERNPAGEGGANEYVFYDGPPFANGLPHYGHIITGFVKDAVPRYRTMRGRRVERRFGWDCHGLPAEVEAEQQLGISGKPEILAMGVRAFNEACRTSVLRYTDEWERYVTRMARWVDFENDYKTLDLTYMESVMWAFKSLYDKGLVYEGFKVLAYCWRCETPLSNTETRMDDVYANRQDPALTVWFQLETGERALAWTTTPWTLPANLALAVAPAETYAVVEHEGERYVIGEARLAAYAREFGDEPNVVATMPGSELVGRRYEPLLPYLADTEGAFRVLAGDFVTTDEGTGIVHLAPAFGEDDQNACNAAGIPTIVTIDDHARFTALVPDYQGEHVFEANRPIIARLKEAGRVLRHETYDHPYPHCWRCRNPLVYKAVSSWFIEVTRVRDRMVELNQQITWVPEHVKEGSFGKWLANARDWSISRNRFWGSPIPVWRSDDPNYPRTDVYGSLDELERDFGLRPDDLHRPMIDELTRPNPDDPTGRSTMRRVPEVLDCWFESGSMPFAQVHYPFENADWFEHHYPGDFIVEYIGQTRGWFYTLHVIATALFDRPSFLSCLVHGIILGDDGQKMSKSLRNYPDPTAMFDLYGADAMRWYLLSSPVLRGADGPVTEVGIRDAVRQALNPLWNSWYFFGLYANAAGAKGRFRTDQTDVLDRYLLAKLHDLVRAAETAMDVHDLFGACTAVRAFLESLTNWYIRRSRDRFWAEDGDAFDTLYTALHVLSRVAAPLLPMVTEEVYKGLSGERSVHLTDWPDAASLPADPELVAAMDLAREVCSAALSVRKANGLRVRQPLESLMVTVPGATGLEPFVDLVSDEVNVRHVKLSDEVNENATYQLKLIPAALGPRLGNDMPKVMAAYKRGDWERRDNAAPVVGGIELAEGEFELALVPVDPSHSAVLAGGTGVVSIDTEVTAELAAEGLVRDVIRAVNQARRGAGLHVSDRIELMLDGLDEVVEAVESSRGKVEAETLAISLGFGPPAGHGWHQSEADLADNARVGVALRPAAR